LALTKIILDSIMCHNCTEDTLTVLGVDIRIDTSLSVLVVLPRPLGGAIMQTNTCSGNPSSFGNLADTFHCHIFTCRPIQAHLRRMWKEE
jgi:hypothetical protein